MCLLRSDHHHRRRSVSVTISDVRIRETSGKQCPSQLPRGAGDAEAVSPLGCKSNGSLIPGEVKEMSAHADAGGKLRLPVLPKGLRQQRWCLRGSPAARLAPHQHSFPLAGSYCSLSSNSWSFHLSPQSGVTSMHHHAHIS